MSRRTNMCWSLGLLPAHPSWMFTLTAVQHFALILNSSINFVVYCAMGTKYATLNSSLYLLYACKYLTKGKKDKMHCKRKNLHSSNQKKSQKCGILLTKCTIKKIMPEKFGKFDHQTTSKKQHNLLTAP